MTDLSALLDSYGRRARLYPALLTLLPAVATAFAWGSSLVSGLTVASVVTLAATFGLLYALANVSRSLGKGVETRLLKQWGCWPTTQMLRHRSPGLSSMTRARYHGFLKQAGPNLELPTAEQEEADPDAADEVYSSAVEWLKEQRREDTFRILHNENAEYGFRRNMRGLKPAGLVVCAASVLGWVAALLLAAPNGTATEAAELLRLPNTLAWAAIGITLLAALGWVFLVRDKWVKEAADHYALALLATCDAPSKAASA